jgi:alcohol dehydrogenase class IV
MTTSAWTRRRAGSHGAIAVSLQDHPSEAALASDDEARGEMLLAAAYAGIGFGNAGVHLPHGMSYPVSGMVRDYVPVG